MLENLITTTIIPIQTVRSRERFNHIGLCKTRSKETPDSHNS